MTVTSRSRPATPARPQPSPEPPYEDDELVDVLPTNPDEAYKVLNTGLDELREPDMVMQAGRQIPGGTASARAALRSISAIEKDLSRELPKAWLYLVDKGGGRKLTAYSWFRVNQAFSKYAPGWRSEVTNIHSAEGHIIVGIRITIPTLEGDVYREDVGGAYEHLDTAKRSKGFDPALKAKQQALKRAAAQFGFGLYLYDVDRD